MTARKIVVVGSGLACVMLVASVVFFVLPVRADQSAGEAMLEAIEEPRPDFGTGTPGFGGIKVGRGLRVRDFSTVTSQPVEDASTTDAIPFSLGGIELAIPRDVKRVKLMHWPGLDNSKRLTILVRGNGFKLFVRQCNSQDDDEERLAVKEPSRERIITGLIKAGKTKAEARLMFEDAQIRLLALDSHALFLKVLAADRKELGFAQDPMSAVELGLVAVVRGMIFGPAEPVFRWKREGSTIYAVYCTQSYRGVDIFVLRSFGPKGQLQWDGTFSISGAMKRRGNGLSVFDRILRASSIEEVTPTTKAVADGEPAVAEKAVLTVTWTSYHATEDPNSAIYIVNGKQIGKGRFGFARVLARLRTLPKGHRVHVGPDYRLWPKWAGNRPQQTTSTGPVHWVRTLMPFEHTAREYEALKHVVKERGLDAWFLGYPELRQKGKQQVKKRIGAD